MLRMKSDVSFLQAIEIRSRRTQSHTPTQTHRVQSQVEKKTEEEEEDEEEKVVRDTESLFVLSIPCCFYCYNRPVSQSVTLARRSRSQRVSGNEKCTNTHTCRAADTA